PSSSRCSPGWPSTSPGTSGHSAIPDETRPGLFLTSRPIERATVNQADLPFLRSIKWTAEGLVPAIVQDSESGDVLMMAWMDEPAIRQTLATGQTHFYSRSRKASWHKGGTSGHVQVVESIHV